jgi:cytochrome c oxidase accessory protein FixG
MKTAEFIAPVKFDKEAFRDTISTIDKNGDRLWIYPKKPKGKFTNYRTLVSIIFLVFFFSAPLITVHDEPLILLNILERKFVLFGFLFRPQDFGLLAIGFITFIIFIVIFTMVFGRVFCGWVCPQTIFMEMIFRKIEYWIEGDWKSQMVLDKADNSPAKSGKKFLKHSIFFIISFIISNTFLIYIIGINEWTKIIKESPSEHLGGLSSIVVFTGIFYWIYARFREQVCTTVCPYGRLQGVLLDKQSIVVAYDYIRGENRGKIRKGEDRLTAQKGDCIDCNQCVNVCPTGIDIRNGTQLECINCTACIDACNFMMQKVGLPQGLIRLDSEEGIAKSKKFKVTSRIFAYSVVLCLLIGFFSILLATRTDIQTSILRAPGVLYQKESGDQISNLYNIIITNKTNKKMPLELRVLFGSAQIRLVGTKNLEVKEEGETEGVLFIVMKRKDIHDLKTRLIVGVYSEGKLIEKVRATFIGPVN